MAHKQQQRIRLFVVPAFAQLFPTKGLSMGYADQIGVSRPLPGTLFLVLCIGGLMALAFREPVAIDVRGRASRMAVYTLDAA